MTVTPVPAVTVGGLDITPGPAVNAPLTPGSPPMVLDGFSVGWGRGDVYAQPGPEPGSLRIFDPSRGWGRSTGTLAADASGLDPGSLPGQEVTVRWQDPADPTRRRIFYRGRIAQVTRAPHTAAGVRGVLVTLTLAGILADLTGQPRPTVANPAETRSARAAWVAGVAALAEAPALVAITTTGTTVLAPVDAGSQQDLLQHLYSLTDVTGWDRPNSHPQTRTAGTVGPRIFWDDSFYSGGARVDVHGLAGLRLDPERGAYPAAYPVDRAAVLRAGPQVPGPWLVLDSRALEYDPADGVTRGLAQITTRAEARWSDAADGYKAKTAVAVVGPGDYREFGSRAVRIDTLATTQAAADSAAARLGFLAQGSGGYWQLAPLTWRTAEFEDWTAAGFFLAGYESDASVFLAASFLPAIGVRPVVGIIGGTIGYEGGRWALSMQTAPVDPGAGGLHAITWEEIDDGTPGSEVQLWDGDHPHGMAASLTLDDLTYVATGVGVTATPTAGANDYAEWGPT